MRPSAFGLCILIERSTHIQRCLECDLYRDPWKSLRLCRLLKTCGCFLPGSAEGRAAGLFSEKLTLTPGLSIQCSNFYPELRIHRAPVVSTTTGFVHILQKETQCPSVWLYFLERSHRAAMLGTEADRQGLLQSCCHNPDFQNQCLAEFPVPICHFLSQAN